jgi:ribonuclease HI
MSRDEEGSSSNRAEHAAACIALEDVIAYRPLILLTDSKCLLTAIQKWIGEAINPSIKASPDGNILREILELLRARIDLGLFTLFVKIKSHRGKFFNEMADRWAEKVGTQRPMQDGRV